MANSKEESFSEFIMMLGRRIYERTVRGNFDYKKDMRQLEHYRTQAQRVNMPLLEARMMNAMAILASVAGHMDEAEALYKQLLDLYAAHENAEGTVRTLNNLAEGYFTVGRNAEALALYDRGIAIAEKMPELIVDYAHIVTGKLVMLVDAARFDEAQGLVEQLQARSQALVEADRQEYARLYVQVYNAMAEIALHHQQVIIAWQHVRRALELAEGLNLTFERAQVYFVKAHIALHDANAPQPAPVYWQEGQAILDNIQAPAHVGRTLMAEGRYLCKHQRGEQARHFLQKALDIFTKHNMVDDVQQVQALFMAMPR